MSSGGAISGNSSASYVAGPFRWTYNSSSTVTQYFPIGNISVYRPVIQTISHNNANTNVYSIHLKSPTIFPTSLSSGVAVIDTRRFWEVIPIVKNSSITQGEYTFNWEASDGVNVTADLIIAKLVNSSWRKVAGNPVITGTNNAGTITIKDNDQSLNSYVLASSTTASPLPVELLSLEATQKENNVVISWSTASELNNDYFEVERSIDGQVFQIIDRVQGHGTTQELINYDVTDRQIFGATTLYYRLRQVDYNGDFEYTHIVTTRISNDNFAGTPSLINNQGLISLKMQSSENAYQTAKIIDNLGKERLSINVSLTQGFNNLNIDATSLKPGIYTLMLSGSNGLWSARFSR